MDACCVDAVRASHMPAVMWCAALLVALGAGSADAQVQRCTDANGKVSFSDTVCDGNRAVKVFSALSTASQQWKPEGYRAPLPMPVPTARRR
jgi:hypothetical protein